MARVRERNHQNIYCTLPFLRHRFGVAGKAPPRIHLPHVRAVLGAAQVCDTGRAKHVGAGVAANALGAAAVAAAPALVVIPVVAHGEVRLRVEH